MRIEFASEEGIPEIGNLAIYLKAQRLRLGYNPRSARFRPCGYSKRQ